jgi:PAS domain S-box-containing protein
MTTTKNQETDATKKSIFLSITYDGTIKEFNKECEKLTGYLRSEVLDKNIKDFLIPQHNLSAWNKLIAVEKKQKTNETYDITLQNKQKKEIEMSLTILSLNKKNDLEESFLLIGNEKQPQQTPFNNIILNEEINEQLFENNSQQPQQTQQNSSYEDITAPSFNQQKNTDTKKTDTKPSIEKLSYIPKKNKKRIRIKKLPSKKQKKENNQLQHTIDSQPKKHAPYIQPMYDIGILNIIQPQQPQKTFQDITQPKNTQPTNSTTEQHTSNTNDESTITTTDEPAISATDETQIHTNQPLTELVQHYQSIQEKINHLEQKEQQLEEKNQILEQKIQEYTTALNQKNKETSKQKIKEKTIQEKKPKNQLFSKLPNPLSIKKNKDELQQKIEQLDEKEKQLQEFESQLLHDRKQYNQQIAQMTDWKEKLLCLESEIEKRRLDLLEHETLLTQQISTPLPQQPTPDKNAETKQQLTIDTIQQSAAVIQRGIIKQINSSFSKLLGYNDKEILEKSLFDFVAPEGLTDIEQYYLQRLKGNKQSTYQTIFSTKSEDSLQATVTLQSTEFNGDSAEIAIIDINKPGKNQESKNSDRYN